MTCVNKKTNLKKTSSSSSTFHPHSQCPGHEQANNTFTKRKFSLKCLKCNGPHKLIQCKKVTDKEKCDLWEKFKHKFGRRKPTPQANTTNIPTPESTAQQPSPAQANTVITTKKGTLPVYVADFHEAFTATNIPTKGPKRSVKWVSMARVNKHRRCRKHEGKNKTKLSLMSQWLIDSGCSNRMTPYKDDLVTKVERSDSLVEVENGTLVPAPHEGSTRIHIVDIDGTKSHNIILNNMLHVPGLSRRLFSVTQWTQSGGSIGFNGNTCNL